ncbi:hypothetical protein XENTR_v10009727 [Xenopus tropicalis]|uniref:Uncharacterized protein LOC116409793 n=1 Tax=Xenopus tropicalis TaxID=8364 RepID=A0A8J1JEV7_XENTR|nr:uncharacterized protein LOC116409793 [Xenopus tropicalis]XP_031755177.1 uncharacterized protein LOC116409793 [Xenopus tropicalis]KAE8619348.1 hypothetical protein XENTR_v10009727 [Xenopus tropicalis]
MAVKDTNSEKGKQTHEVKFQATGSTTEITVSTLHGPGYVENRISITFSSARGTPKCTPVGGPECNSGHLENARKRKAWQISEEPTCSSMQHSEYSQKPNEKCHGSMHTYKSEDSPSCHKAPSATANPLCGNKKPRTGAQAKNISSGQKREQGKQTKRQPRVTKTKTTPVNTINEDSPGVSNKDNPTPAEEQVTPVKKLSTETCTHFHCTIDHSSNVGGLTWFLKLFFH